MPALLAKANCLREMSMPRSLPKWAVAVILLITVSTNAPACGQLINVQQPFRTATDSFFNRTGVNFGLSFRGGSRIVGLNPAGQITPNINITQNSVGSTIPPFGGYDPGADLNAGVAVIGGDVGFSLGLVAGKGSTRSLTSTTPSVTMFNGQTGSIFSGQLSPFVTGIVPVAGNSTGTQMVRSWGLPQGMKVSGPPERPINTSPQSYSDPSSTATRGVLGLAEIERMKANAEFQQQLELDGEIRELVERARELVEQKKYGAARAKYSRAIRKLGENENAGELRGLLSSELDAIRDLR